jgi:hypothetical protein
MKLTMRLAAVVFGFMAATSARADISVGPNPLPHLTTTDTDSGLIIPAIQFSAADAGQTVLSYTFYTPLASPGTNTLTPLLLEEAGVGSPSFSVIGIGQSSTGFTQGVNTETFTMSSGTAKVQDGLTFFGFLDGTANGSETNTGTIGMNYPTGPGPTLFYYATGGAGVTLDTPIAFSSLAAIPQNSRTYAVDATITPEPAFYGLLAFGLAGLAFAVVRRRSTGSLKA